ncbi:MAG: hypothetical protein QOH87_3280, partial [Trebonia sp.]|nr:hypothetical protein [Trebonia sp.]
MDAARATRQPIVDKRHTCTDMLFCYA